jgi:hypothetical protein
MGDAWMALGEAASTGAEMVAGGGVPLHAPSASSTNSPKETTMVFISLLH